MNLNIQDLVSGIFGLIRKLIPDADKRKEIELALITLMHNLRSKWMINLLTIWITALYTCYLFGFPKAFVFNEILHTFLFICWLFHFGISPESAIKLLKNMKDFLKKKRGVK